MTATLLVVVPVVLLVLIGSLCFVGCTLDTHGLGQGFTQYSDLDILKNPDCVAYWQLSDSPGQNLALDIVGKAKDNPHHGTYKNAGNVSGADTQLFPIPFIELGPTVHSPAAPGTQTIGAPGIVQGDTVPPHDKDNPILTTCMLTDGGFVTVAANDTCNPPVFSVECWVRPEWSANDEPATRQIIDSRNVDMAGMAGYGLRINEDGNWHAQIGHTNSGGVFMDVVASIATLNAVSHVVLTFDGTTAAVFVNGIRTSPLTSIPAGESFSPNIVAPLIIGAGGPYQPNRTTGAVEPPPLFPFVPFKGKIQNVAIYNTVLDEATIKKHTEHGKGNSIE